VKLLALAGGLAVGYFAVTSAQFAGEYMARSANTAAARKAALTPGEVL